MPRHAASAMAIAFAPSICVARSYSRRALTGRRSMDRCVPGSLPPGLIGHDSAPVAAILMLSLQKNLLTWATRRRSIPSVLRWNFFGRDSGGRNLSPPWTVLTLYRIITVFLTLFFRGSCDSSSSSCYLCACPSARPRHGLPERPFLVSIFLQHKSLEA